MLLRKSEVLFLALIALALPGAAWAGAMIQSMNGDVRVGGSKQILIAARPDQRLAAGTTIVTGTDAQAVIKMDDGGQMVLGQNTEFRIVDSQYARNSPQADRAVFDLVRGALRVVSGAIGQRSRQTWALRLPQVTIGLRGTDFMVALTNQAFINVSHGAIVASNGYGSTVLGAGSIAAVPSSTAAVSVIPASSLPTAASTAFSGMSAAPGVVAGGSSVGAAGGVAAAGGIGAGAAGLGAAIAAIAAAAGGKGGGGKTVSQHAVTHNPSP
jgi:hypothetical protein